MVVRDFSYVFKTLRSLPAIHTLSFLRHSMYVHMEEPFLLTFAKLQFSSDVGTCSLSKCRRGVH